MRCVIRWTAVLVAAVSLAPGLGAQEFRRSKGAFDVFTEKKPDEKIGSMDLQVTRVSKSLIVKQDFRTEYKDTTIRMENQFVYRWIGNKVQLIRGSATTWAGDLKLMTGEVKIETETDETGESHAVARVTAEGYADMKEGAFESTKAKSWDVKLPPGPRVAWAALPAFGPDLIEAGGAKIDPCVNVEMPDDLEYPELVNFKGGCVLSRTKESGSRFRITMHRNLPGGNKRLLQSVVFEDDKPVEIAYGRFILRPAKEE